MRTKKTSPSSPESPAKSHRRRESILEAVSYAAGRFLKCSTWDEDIKEILKRLGTGADVSRVYIFENHAAEDGTLLTSQRYEWTAKNITPQIDNPALQNISYQKAGFSRWVRLLKAGKTIQAHVREMPEKEREFLSAQDIQSIVVVPISSQKSLWGFMGFDECRKERDWSTEDIEALKTAASTLGAAIENQMVRARFQASDAELRAVFKAMNEVVLIFDSEGRNLKVLPTNPERGLSPHVAVVGKSLHAIFPGKQADILIDKIRKALEMRKAVQVEIPMRTGLQEEWKWISSTLTPLSKDTVVLVGHDITARKQAEQAMQESESKYRGLFEHLLEGVYQSTPEGRILAANPALVRLLGYNSEEDLLLSNALDSYVNPEDRRIWSQRLAHEGVVRNFEVALKRKDGRVVHVLENAYAVRDEQDRVLYYEGTMTDITERKRLEAQLLFLVNRDPLTNLFNRRRFREELELQMTQARRFSVPVALLWMDLDHFKEVNDTLGHRAGDELLIQFARLLQSHFREADILTRMGGDEFAVLMPRVDAEQAQTAASRLLKAIHRHTFEFSRQPIRFTVSIGIALFPEHGTTADKLLIHADLAMYRAKEEGGNRFCMERLEESWESRIESGVVWIKKIREALDENRFLLFAQPILDLKKKTVSQYELLLRLSGKTGGLLTPESFIGVASQFNLILEIDRWVVRQAINLIKERIAAGRPMPFGINLSPKAFNDPELSEIINEELALEQRSMLVIEITEISTVEEFPLAQEFIRSIKKLGCRCALDDFGVGLTSFRHLNHLPFDFLKIDSSLIRGLPKNPVNRHLVRAILHSAKLHDMRTIAEGVDDKETLQTIFQYGVDFAQGFQIGEPAAVSGLFK